MCETVAKLITYVGTVLGEDSRLSAKALESAEKIVVVREKYIRNLKEFV